MIMGADVTHKVAGISVAGVVGSADSSYAPRRLDVNVTRSMSVNLLNPRAPVTYSIVGY